MESHDHYFRLFADPLHDQLAHCFPELRLPGRVPTVEESPSASSHR